MYIYKETIRRRKKEKEKKRVIIISPGSLVA
jgi:hypothetical protein